MPIPFTEVLVKFSPLLEDSSTLVNLPLNLDSKNLSSRLKLLLLKMLWVVFTTVSIKEEVLLKKKNKSLVPPCLFLNASYLSLNLSVSPLT